METLWSRGFECILSPCKLSYKIFNSAVYKITRKIFSILSVKNRHFIYTLKHTFIELEVEQNSAFLIYGLSPHSPTVDG